jgi:signal transduction histidine kinase/DNA-binding NarL/FixJ family response regulator
MRLLLVDDDEVDRAAVHRALRNASLEVEVCEATAVASARRMLAENRFDALLLDYHLPDGSGRELLETALRAAEPTPVIVLTGQGDEALAVELMKVGARDYIPKQELSPPRLAQSLRRVVDVARAEREAARARRAHQFLADASARLAQSLDTSATLEHVARLAVPEIADHCLLHVVELDGAVRAGAACHLGGPESTNEAQAIRALESTTSSPLMQALATERAVVMNGGPSPVPAGESDPAALEVLRSVGASSLASLPLIARGRTLGVLTVANSVSRRRYDEQDLNVLENLATRAALALDNARLYEDARRAATARDEMLAVVSHDLRNPLNVIATSAAMLLEFEFPEETKRIHLEAIRRTTDRMNRLIQDLLDVTSIESGKLSIRPQPIEAGGLLEEAREMMAPLATERGIHISCEGPGDEVFEADRGRILQVFANLVGNAIKATPTSGRITLGGSGESDRIRFWVQDAGTGIAPDDLPYIFERFWRGRDQRETGTGLGLPIAKGIVEVHGGRIWVESLPGQGSRFSFELPRDLTAVQTEAAVTAA